MFKPVAYKKTKCIIRTCVTNKDKGKSYFNPSFLFICKLSSCLHFEESMGPDQILRVPGPKKFWMPWRMTQKRISRKTSLAKYDFRKSGGARGPCPLAPSSSRGLEFYLVVTFVKLVFLYCYYLYTESVLYCFLPYELQFFRFSLDIIWKLLILWVFSQKRNKLFIANGTQPFFIP